MTDAAETRGKLIRHLEEAMALADEIGDAATGYLIERALDEWPTSCARSRSPIANGRKSGLDRKSIKRV
jgi:hypothetical protein